MPVSLTTITVSAGGSLTFNAGLIANKIVAISPALLQAFNDNITIGELTLTNTVMTIGSGVLIDAATVQMTESIINSLGVLHLAASASLTVDGLSTITATGKGLQIPAFVGGGDSRGTVGLGGVHAGCMGNDCAMRQTNAVMAYGDPFDPTTPGASGTGAGSGAGGGVIIIEGGSMSIYGKISADGANATGSGGGGAGGSIKITGLSIQMGSTGNLSAVGGYPANASSHPGSGGRIAIITTSETNYNALMNEDRFSVFGGRYATGAMGAPGTYYLSMGSKTFLTTSHTGTLHAFATVFAFCYGDCPTLTSVRTVPNTEIVFSSEYVGTGCITAQASGSIGTVDMSYGGGYVTSSPCVNLVIDNFEDPSVNTMPQLISNTASNQQYVDAYYNAYFGYESWSSVSSAVAVSNSALQNRLTTVEAALQQCNNDLAACLTGCVFPLFERPSGPIVGGQAITYRVAATKSNDAIVTQDEAELGVKSTSLYLSSILLYPRASIVYKSHEIRGSTLIAYFFVTVPANGSKAGECLESHLQWNH